MTGERRKSRVVLKEMILLQGSAPDPVDWGFPGSPPDVPNGDPWPTPGPGTVAPLTTRDVLRFGTMNDQSAPLRYPASSSAARPSNPARAFTPACRAAPGDL